MDLICSYDLETTNLNGSWGRILCGVIKPWGEEPELYTMKRANSDDSKVVKQLVDRLNQFSVHVAHNGRSFDRPFLNTRATQLGIEGLRTGQKLIDPVVVARRHLRTGSNTLDALSQHFGLDEGKYHIPPLTWVKAALDNDREAWAEIHERCLSDVRVLEKVLERLLPYLGNITPFGSA